MKRRIRQMIKGTSNRNKLKKDDRLINTKEFIKDYIRLKKG